MVEDVIVVPVGALGRDSEPGVSKPRMEYSTPLRGDAARFKATMKKNPKLTTFSSTSIRNGMKSAVSISACPELSRPSFNILMTTP
jgi:hypothetical protein